MTGRPVVGSRYIIKKGGNGFYKEGDVVRFEEDDGSSCPWFYNLSRDTNNGNRIAVDLVDIEEEKVSKFKIGDAVHVISKYKGGGSRITKELLGTNKIGYIIEIDAITLEGDRVLIVNTDPDIPSGDYFKEEDLVLINGETTMTTETEEFAYPEFVTIIKNTEVFKKGGVFNRNGGYYYIIGGHDSAYQAKPYETTLRMEQVKVLLDKKVAVEAVKFNPEFVTLEQNEALTQTLANLSKPAKKAASSAKKSVSRKKA